jgi:periplasmic protein TonB
MRIDRYVHDERLTWGATGILVVVAAVHAGVIGRLLLTAPDMPAKKAADAVFQVSLQKLPPLRLPPQLQPADDKPPPPSDAVRQQPRQTRPVPILVDTPSTNPVSPDTQVKPYELGDELLPGTPGPPMKHGVPGGEGLDDVPVTTYAKLKLLHMNPPDYPPRCLRMGIEGTVRVRVLVGENGRPQEVSIDRSSGDASLDQAALEAVRHWRFEPAMRQGVPVRAWVIAPMEFKLLD